MNPIPGELNDMEMEFATLIGQGRFDRRIAEGRLNAHGSTAGAEDNILGVMGEMFFAKVTNRYPSGLFLDIYEDDDVGGIQVRTRRKDSFDLYMWKSDPKDCLWALITGEGPAFTYWGTIHGKDAAIDKYWTKAGRPFPRESCWVIPKEALDEP